MRIAAMLMLGWVCSHSVALSQQSAGEADSVSYALFLQQDWINLALYGEMAAFTGYDFYYLNLRTGVAYYHLRKWGFAKKWFQKAITNYAEDTIAAEYLYWIQALKNQPVEAADIYASLSRTSQQRINNPPKKLISSVSLSGGLRAANKPDSVNTFNYASLKLSHKFSPALQLQHSYAYLSQDYFWGSYQQHNYYVAPEYRMRRGWTISTSVNLIKYARDFDYAGAPRHYADTTIVRLNQDEETVVTDAVYDLHYAGTLALEAYYAHLAVSKSFGNAHLSLQYARYQDQQRARLTETIDSLTVINYYQNGELRSSESIQGATVRNLDANASYHQHQVGGSVSFTFPMQQGRFMVLGVESQLVMGAENHLHVIPFFTLQIRPGVILSGNYLRKGSYPLAVFNGALVLNNNDRYHHRFSMTGTYQVTANLRLLTTFQWEHLNNEFLTGAYTSTGVFAGAQWNF